MTFYDLHVFHYRKWRGESYAAHVQAYSQSLYDNRNRSPKDFRRWAWGPPSLMYDVITR